MKAGDKVRCIRGYADRNVLEKGAVYIVGAYFEGEVAFPVAHDGHAIPTKLPKPLVIVINPTCPYPYFWDADRFEAVE